MLEYKDFSAISVNVQTAILSWAECHYFAS